MEDITDEDGYYFIDDVPAGEWEIYFWHPEYFQPFDDDDYPVVLVEADDIATYDEILLDWDTYWDDYDEDYYDWDDWEEFDWDDYDWDDYDWDDYDWDAYDWEEEDYNWSYWEDYD